MNLEDEGLDVRGSDKKQQQAVEKFLREYVEELLVNEVDALLTGHPLQPELPQVLCISNCERLREYHLVRLFITITSYSEPPDPCEGDIHERVSPAAAGQVRKPLRDARRQPLRDPPLQEERRQERQGISHI